MKVSLPKNYKDYFTITNLEQAKMVIDFEKQEDESSAKIYADIAVRHALSNTNECLIRIIEVDAEVARNDRLVDGAYGETGNMDVYLSILARTDKGYLEVGAYLTDIWNIGPDVDVKPHMWIQGYEKSLRLYE